MSKKMDHMTYADSLRGVSVDSLKWQLTDARLARDIFPEGPNASYYADEVCYLANELHRRGADDV